MPGALWWNPSCHFNVVTGEPHNSPEKGTVRRGRRLERELWMGANLPPMTHSGTSEGHHTAHTYLFSCLKLIFFMSICFLCGRQPCSKRGFLVLNLEGKMRKEQSTRGGDSAEMRQACRGVL